MTNQTEHHAEAILRAAVPVGYLYEYQDRIDGLLQYFEPLRQVFQYSIDAGYTETPLYPASAILDAVQAERAAIVAWLLSPAFSYGDYSIAREANFLAYMIKRGEHLPQGTPQ